MQLIRGVVDVVIFAQSITRCCACCVFDWLNEMQIKAQNYNLHLLRCELLLARDMRLSSSLSPSCFIEEMKLFKMKSIVLPLNLPMLLHKLFSAWSILQKHLISSVPGMLCCVRLHKTSLGAVRWNPSILSYLILCSPFILHRSQGS